MLLLSAKSTAKVYSEMPNGVFPKNHVSNPPPNVNDIHLRHAADGGTFFEAEIARLKNSRQALRAKEQFFHAASRSLGGYTTRACARCSLVRGPWGMQSGAARGERWAFCKSSIEIGEFNSRVPIT